MTYKGKYCFKATMFDYTDDEVVGDTQICMKLSRIWPPLRRRIQTAIRQLTAAGERQYSESPTVTSNGQPI